VFFRDESQSSRAEIITPPCLVIRRGVSFWVEHRALCEWTATLQALNEGCFRDACIYDVRGDLLQVVDAQFAQRPSWVDSLLRYREMLVQFELRPMPKPAMTEVLAELAEILQSANEFVENVDADAGKALECLKWATTPTELIACAESCA